MLFESTPEAPGVRDARQRKRAWIAGAIVFAGWLAIALANFWLGYVEEHEKVATSLDALKADYRRLHDSTRAPDGSPQKVETPFTTEPKAGGEAGEMERMLRTVTAESIAQRNEYHAAMEAAGWDRMLDAERLRRDTELRESREIMAVARGLVERYEAKSRELLDGMPARIAALKLKAATKSAMLAGFEKTAEANRAKLRELWELERRSLAEVEGALQVLASNRRKWSFEDGNFVFSDDRALAAFNARMTAVQALARQQAELQQRNLDTALASLDKLKR